MEKKPIEIVCTATLRAEILERTLISFKERMFRDWPARLIINVDPVGPDSLKDVMAVARRYFPVASVRAASEPSFPVAFKWVWSQTEADYVFHLEDDWELLRDIHIEGMIDLMYDLRSLAVLRLPWKPTGERSMKNWKYFFPYTFENYFECPPELRRSVGFCGHPSLIRGIFVQRTRGHLDITRNPEKQFHHGPTELMREVDRWRYGVYGQCDQSAAIRDIGREWMVRNGYRKAGSKAFFTQWEKNE